MSPDRALPGYRAVVDVDSRIEAQLRLSVLKGLRPNRHHSLRCFVPQEAFAVSLHTQCTEQPETKPNATILRQQNGITEKLNLIALRTESDQERTIRYGIAGFEPPALIARETPLADFLLPSVVQTVDIARHPLRLFHHDLC